MFRKVLIANRGEIACRVIRTCRELGIQTVAVYTSAEPRSLYAEMADEAYLLPEESMPAASYLNIDSMVDAARSTNADAIHPGYGFLSENPNFARACENAGIVFIGPPGDVIEAMANKRLARQQLTQLGVPVLPGTTVHLDGDAVIEEAALELGLPLMVKASEGGGGIGLSFVEDSARLARAVSRARSTAQRAFGSTDIYLEKYIRGARHVEVQVLADQRGNCLHLYERECSVQRRHQKLIEETPSPALTTDQRQQLVDSALIAARGIGYQNAGTFEFILAPDGDFYFLEANTRLQVEHGVTELTTGIDLVEHQLRVAVGQPLDMSQSDVSQKGHSIECRVYAEHPETFLPSPGTITSWSAPEGDHVRVDSAMREGDEVTTFFDPLLAKVLVLQDTRHQAIDAMIQALASFVIEGVTTNVPFLIKALSSPQFRSGQYSTLLADELAKQ